ncbi:MAG TPA: TonB-dependent receptor [Chitinophagaceae bacterium]|nr:TonB-dependent receptor [Chitinophagaceae bacterium]
MVKRLIILLLSFYTNAIGQYALAQIKVSGIVADSLTNDRLAFVTVRLMDKNQVLLRNSVSDSLGRFYFENVAFGTYQLHFSITGYAPKKSEVFTVGDTSIILPLYLMNRSSKTLAEVTLTAQRPLISTKIDGFVYNAAQGIQSAGESASDLLRKIPGVQVDQNGTPHMRGSNRIKVFIDGRPSVTYASSVADALRQISADNIKTVEVITHPSARYDAEGVDGVINIFTKRPVEDGISGTINGILANRFNELTGAVTWKRQKLVIGTDIGHSYSSNVTTSMLERTDHSINNRGLLQRKEINNNDKNLFGGINIIYVPDSLTTINAGYRYGGNWFGTESVLDNLTGSDAFTRAVSNPAFRYLHGINAGWLHKSRDKSTEFNIMGYWFYQGQQSHYILDQYRAQQKDYSEKNRNIFGNREFSFQTDINKKFKGGNELEAGVKSAFRKFSYENLFEVFDFNKSMYLSDSIRADRFWFNWAIVAAYGSYTINLNSWKIKAGGRYEHTHWPLHFRDTSINVPDYRNFLPNIIISKVIAPNHNISIGYARKLLRPYINYLNPVVNYIDSLNLEYGNPNLKPAITNSYDLSYTFQKSSWLLNVAMFYNQTGNSIEQVRIEQPNGIVANTYANVADYDVLGASINASLRLKRFTFAMTNTTRHLEFNSQNSYPYRDGFIISQSLDVSFKPSISFTVRAYANLNSRSINLQGFTTGVQSYTLSVNKELLNGKLNLSARCDNLFAPYRYVTEIVDTETFGQHLESRYINRFFRLAVRWKLGKKEVKRPQVKEIGGY